MNYKEFVQMDQQADTHWWYTARRRLLEHQLKTQFRNSTSLKILDLASACGNNFSVCSPYGKAYGIDISEHSINYCRKKNISTIVQGDVQILPFKSNTYDLVIALDVFEHLQNDTVSMQEIGRVLKDGGKLIFNTPACKALFSFHDEAFQHIRRYNARELKRKLSDAGLQTVFITYWSFFIFPFIFVLRKVLNHKRITSDEALSDFHMQLNPFIEKMLKFIYKIEIIFIKKNVSFLFGVSIFGIAQKKQG